MPYKKRGPRKKKKIHKLLLDQNDKGGINVISPSSPGESLCDRLKKETGKKT